MKNNIYDFIFTILYIELRPTIMNVFNYARKYFNKEHHIREKLIKIKTHVTEEEKREHKYYLNKLNIPYNIS